MFVASTWGVQKVPDFLPICGCATAHEVGASDSITRFLFLTEATIRVHFNMSIACHVGICDLCW